ncbi:MAG: hypothetical protein R3F39_12460 [Myxococcota bacterium]
MTPVWIIDDGPLDTLAGVVDHRTVASWPTGKFVVADATASAATGDRRKLLEAAGQALAPFSVMMGTEAERTLFGHLRRPNEADKNLAEHQSIAWALHEEPRAVFVGRDKGAAYLALAELGRCRAAHPSDLWLHLREQRLISEAEFAALCAKTQSAETLAVPLRCQTRAP